MHSKPFLRVALVAAAFFAVEAQAQIEQVSFNFGEIRLDYQPVPGAGLPIAVDLQHGEDGAVSLHARAGLDVTLKRGRFYPADPLPLSWLLFDLDDARGQSLGLLSLQLEVRRAGPHVKVLDVNSVRGAGLHVGGAQVLMSDGSVRFISASIDTRLSGEPAALFNQPGPGEALEARLPVPAPGQTLALQLVVSDDRGARMRLPVRISHPR